MTKADPQTLSRDDVALTAAFLIALAATLGALFIGEVLGQIAFMYGTAALIKV